VSKIERNRPLKGRFAPRSGAAKTGAFTLIELLVVIAVISILAALIFPVFFTVRGKARQTVCVSNLRQLGLAMASYTDDYDGLFPWGADPADKHSNPGIWDGGNPSYKPYIDSMAPINQVLDPYIKSPKIWECPADVGFDELDMTPSGVSSIKLNARPTLFKAYGTSYFYRTELGLFGRNANTVTARDFQAPFGTHEASEINVLMDGNGYWHGSGFAAGRRFDVLMADGHAVSQNMSTYFHTWSLQVNN